MTVEVELNEISRESWKGKDGTNKSALRLVLIDKDTKAVSRYKGDLVFAVPADQEDLVNAKLKRDMRFMVELTGTRVFGTSLAFDGRIVAESIPSVQQGEGGKPGKGVGLKTRQDESR